MNNRPAEIDFGYRGVHLARTVAAAVIAAYYGSGPAHAYYNGCSSSGRYGIQAAEHYPDDFDGIIAGSPVVGFSGLSVGFNWNMQATLATPIPTAKLPVVFNAVMAACDGTDGLVDGLIDDPRQCHFDLNTLACSQGDGPGCLTPGEIDTQIIDPVQDDLSAFAGFGGKMIIYQGWGDIAQAPYRTIQYYRGLRRHAGRRQVEDYARLFMAPGMYHCGGGIGPNTFDALTALEHWVEEGQPPASILASHTQGPGVNRTRPLCPFPQYAAYTGTGSIDDAANFACVGPLVGTTTSAFGGSERLSFNNPRKLLEFW